MNDKKLKLEMRDPETLVPNAWNPNVMSPENEQKLEASMDRLGMFKPLLVREIDGGVLELLGGEHRWEIARRRGEQVPVINLGRLDDNRAKEISLLDNGRYGTDDSLRLAEVLDGLGDVSELASFMPFSDTDLASIFSSVNIALDDLDLGVDDDLPTQKPKEKPEQTHAMMRFRVPIEDMGDISKLIERIQKENGLKDDDSLTNAGHALVILAKRSEI